MRIRVLVFALLFELNLYLSQASFSLPQQSLLLPEKFQHILRIMGTNVDGKRKVVLAMTAIKGVGRRYANIVLKKADVDLTKRAGECTEEEVSIDEHRVNSKCKHLLIDCVRVTFCAGREIGHDHPEPAPVQDPGVVPQ